MTDQAPDVTQPRHETVETKKELSFKTDPDGHAITATMARGMIATIRTVRPGWRSSDIAAALDECRDSDPVETTLALIAAALNPNVKNPDVIVRNGVWWDAAATYPPKPAPELQVVPLPSRRERQAAGGIRGTDLWKRNYEPAKTKAVSDAKARGGTIITDEDVR